MASQEQIDANRRNAQHSTGPKTPEGKAAVRLNALKHGLTAENAVITGEDVEAFEELRDTFLDQFQPATPLETALVHQIVMAQWRLVRCRNIETGYFELSINDQQDELEIDYTEITRNDKLAQGERSSAQQRNVEVMVEHDLQLLLELGRFRAASAAVTQSENTLTLVSGAVQPSPADHQRAVEGMARAG